MNRLEDLMNRFLDDGLTPEERLELHHAIELDPQCSDQLLECYRQDRVVTELYRPSPALAIDAILAAVLEEDRFVDSTMRQSCAEALSASTIERARPLSLEAWLRRFLPKLAWTVALAAVVIVGLMVWLFPPINNQPSLAFVPGTRLKLERDSYSLPAQNGMSLLPGDLLSVSGTNRITISYGTEPTSLALLQDTELRLLDWRHGKSFELHQGKLEASVARQRPFRPTVLRTIQAEARVLGTKFTLSVTTNATRLDVTEGRVRFTRTADGKEVKVAAGNYAIAAPNYELLAQPMTGSILREYWTNLPGDYFVTILTSNPNFPDHPSGRDYLDKFEAPSHWAKDYGARFSGYLHPPVTGEYTFWLAAADGGDLYLSKDENPQNKHPIGHANTTAQREWTKNRSQQSSAVTLVAGKKYYIEVLQKQGKDDDHLAVAWRGPGRDCEVIPGEFLSPYSPERKEESK